jgi:radical SAM superfamily enzyme YgiQ (UPF0313 family)
MRYEGPIYRPPSESDSLLIQATVGCPHNKCAFCMVYKQGPRYRVRPVTEICEDLEEAKRVFGNKFKTLFFPAGNSIAMPTAQLAAICAHGRALFPALNRITVYGSSQYIHQKGLEGLRRLREAGLTRLHVGMESGDDEVLRYIKKGTDRRQQIEAGVMVREVGIELSEYVILGIGGEEGSRRHALATATAIDAIRPHFLRLRTFVPKVNTLLLHQINRGRFRVLTPHQVLRETTTLIENIATPTRIYSDHYTNYVNLEGRLPEDRGLMLRKLEVALSWDESRFRPYFVGTQ